MIIYSESFLEFLENSECKIAEILYRAHFRISKIPTYKLMLTEKEINYLTFRSDGTISFLPTGKEHIVNEDGDWSRDNRQNGKPAKVIKKLFTDKAKKLFKDSDFECFSHSYKSKFSSSNYTFKLLPNKQIPDVYDMKRAAGGASLNSSCMNNDTRYLDIYKYCNKLNILIMLNQNNELCGRALVWNLEEKITLMDRIYVAEDFMYDCFLSYAKKEGWWHKKYYKTYDHKTLFIDSDGNEVGRTFSIETDTDHDYYPYIDTFQYGYDGSLNNYNGEFTYDETDGTRSGDYDNEDDNVGRAYDDIDGCWIDEDDIVIINRGQHQGDCTHRDNTVDIGNWTYWRDSSGIVCIDDEWHLIEDTCYSEYDQEDYLVDDCVYSDIHNSYILKSDAIKVNGEYYHTDKEGIDFVEIEGDYYLIDDDNIECIDGEYTLKTESETV